MDIQKLKQGYFTDINNLVGLVCKRNIAADSPISPVNIEQEKLVHKGEQVSITVKSQNLTVSMDGIALDEGVFGETIKVKNSSSKKVIERKVSGLKQVHVVF